MGQESLSRLYTLSLFITDVLKHKAQIVEIIHGSAVTIQALHSDVILHVPDGVYGIILGNIHTDHWRFRHLVPEKDCIISPICEFHFCGSTLESPPRFKLLAPHIVRNIYVEVKFQLKQGAVLQIAKRFTTEVPATPSEVFYNVHNGHVEILTDHFTKFLVTAKEIECCCHSAAVLVFSKLNREIADVRIRFASLHYEKQDYLQVNTIFFYSINIFETTTNNIQRLSFLQWKNYSLSIVLHFRMTNLKSVLTVILFYCKYSVHRLFQFLKH